MINPGNVALPFPSFKPSSLSSTLVMHSFQLAL